jgi:hypothetical protein
MTIWYNIMHDHMVHQGCWGSPCRLLCQQPAASSQQHQEQVLSAASCQRTLTWPPFLSAADGLGCLPCLLPAGQR